ncbi:hypothetical protein TSAR_015012 [Trichomalopsis sarcophagae]|uniref:Uncharacterized protein n=1 Tax=Trichomalopsis sarcophagae TaxID=543379 RepID=A0A232EXU2_9HYME|nr:hypothetical protein TSAR_015012 [Trichomalopsis sarcophagae]
MEIQLQHTIMNPVERIIIRHYAANTFMFDHNDERYYTLTEKDNQKIKPPSKLDTVTLVRSFIHYQKHGYFDSWLHEKTPHFLSDFSACVRMQTHAYASMWPGPKPEPNIRAAQLGSTVRAHARADAILARCAYSRFGFGPTYFSYEEKP